MNMKWIINILIHITIYHDFSVKLFVSKFLTEKISNIFYKMKISFPKNFLYIVDNKLSGI